MLDIGCDNPACRVEINGRIETNKKKLCHVQEAVMGDDGRGGINQDVQRLKDNKADKRVFWRTFGVIISGTVAAMLIGAMLIANAATDEDLRCVEEKLNVKVGKIANDTARIQGSVERIEQLITGYIERTEKRDDKQDTTIDSLKDRVNGLEHD